MVVFLYCWSDCWVVFLLFAIFTPKLNASASLRDKLTGGFRLVHAIPTISIPHCVGMPAKQFCHLAASTTTKKRTPHWLPIHSQLYFLDYTTKMEVDGIEPQVPTVAGENFSTTLVPQYLCHPFSLFCLVLRYWHLNPSTLRHPYWRFDVKKKI